MKNPINSLNLKLERHRLELSETQNKLKSLREDHSKLIKDSINLERNFGEFTSAVEDMCEGCIEKNTDSCQDCALHGVAVKFDLWR